MGEFFLPDNVLRRIMYFSDDLFFLTLTSLFSSQNLFNQIINMKYNTPIAKIESLFLVIFTQTYFWTKFWRAKKGFYTKPFRSLYIHNWTIYAYVTNKRRHFSTNCALTGWRGCRIVLDRFVRSANLIVSPNVQHIIESKHIPLLSPCLGATWRAAQTMSFIALALIVSWAPLAVLGLMGDFLLQSNDKL